MIAIQKTSSSVLKTMPGNENRTNRPRTAAESSQNSSEMINRCKRDFARTDCDNREEPFEATEALKAEVPQGAPHLEVRWACRQRFAKQRPRRSRTWTSFCKPSDGMPAAPTYIFTDYIKCSPIQLPTYARGGPRVKMTVARFLYHILFASEKMEVH